MLLTCKTKEMARIVKILSKSPAFSKSIEHFIVLGTDKEKGQLSLAVQNSTYLLRMNMSCNIELDGKIVIPTKNILPYITNNDDEEITIKKIDLQLQIKSQHYKININGYEDIPDFRTENKEQLGVFDGKYLSQAFKNARFCVQKNSPNPVLGSILLSNSKNVINIVGTDSYRLSKTEIEGVEKECSILIPRETTEILTDIISSNNVGVSFNKNQVEFSNNNFLLVSSLIEGVYPNYSLIIPEIYETEIVLETKRLLKAVRISQNSTNKIKLEVGDKSLFLFSKSQAGDNVSEIEFKEKKGVNTNIVLSNQYLLDILSQIDEEEIKLLFMNNLKPLVIENKKFIHLIMPLKDY
jgi:DNA polymerase-3 subunit beta